MTQAGSSGQKQTLKLVVMGCLLVGAGLLTWHFHATLQQCILFTHLFYIPIILACVWWKRKGYIVAAALAVLLLGTHVLFRPETPVGNDYLRALMFMVVAAVVVTLRKRLEKAEKTLRESWKQIQTTFENAEDAIYIKDSSERFVEVNPAVLKRTGLTREEIIGRTSKEIFNVETGELTEYTDKRALSGKTVHQDLTVVHHGRAYDLHVIKAPIRNSDGNITGMCGISRDITEHKRAEKALAESEENFRAIVENANDGIIILDVQGHHVYANKQAAEMIGYTIPELLHVNYKDIVHPDERERLAEKFDRQLNRENVPGHYEVVLVCKDGRNIHVEVTGAGTVWRGEPVDLVIVRDITERKRVEKRLRESEEKYMTLVEHSNDMIWALDKEGRFTYFNKKSEEVTGYKLKEEFNKGFLPIILEEDLEMVHDVFRRTLQGKSLHYEVRIHDIDRKKLITLSVSTAPIYKNKEVVGTVSFGRNVTERKQAEQALKASEERFHDIALSSADWVWEVDAEGRCTFASGKIEQTLGYTPEEMIGRAPFDFMSEEDAERIRRAFEKIISRKEPIVDLENWVRHKDGRRVCLLTNGVPMFDEKGKLLGYRGMDKDITEHKKIERALRESEQRIRIIFEGAEDAIFVKDSQFRFTEVNWAMLQRLGISRDKIIGKTACDLFPPEVAEAIRRFDRLVLDGKTLKEDRTVIHHGRVYEVNVIEVPIRDDEGNVIGLFGISRDITDRKQAEEKLSRSEARYRAVVEDQQELICRFTPDLKIAFVNEAYCRYFGKRSEELIGKTFMPLIPGDDHKRVEDYFAMLRPDNPTTTHEHRVITLSGEIRWQEWTNRLLLDDAGKVVELQAVGRDITEQKHAEEALRQSEKRIRDIFEAASTVSFIKTDLDGMDTQILEFSRGSENIFGYSREEVIGEPLGMLYVSEDFAGFPKVIEIIQRTGKPFTRKLTLVRKSGERFRAQATTYPIYDVKKEMTGLLGVVMELGENP